LALSPSFPLGSVHSPGYVLFKHPRSSQSHYSLIVYLSSFIWALRDFTAPHSPSFKSSSSGAHPTEIFEARFLSLRFQYTVDLSKLPREQLTFSSRIPFARWYFPGWSPTLSFFSRSRRTLRGKHRFLFSRPLPSPSPSGLLVLGCRPP